MQNGDVQRTLHRIPISTSFLFFALVALSGTCELDPPTMPPNDWVFSGEGQLEIRDGANGLMKQVHLSFTEITMPPSQFSYRVFLGRGTDSVFIGGLRPNSNNGPADLVWDDSVRIFSRYHELRINLFAEMGVSPSRSLVRIWWKEFAATKLSWLFGDSGSVFRLLELAKKLETTAVGITNAPGVDSATASIASLKRKQDLWRTELAIIRDICEALATKDSVLTPALATFENIYRPLLREADSLSSFCTTLLSCQECPLEYYQLASFELRRQASEIENQTESLYGVCKQFAVLNITVKPQ